MKVQIEIECETVGELLSHIADIAKTIEIRAIHNTDYCFEVGTQFENNNCYGTHEVTIIPGTE